MANVAIQSGTKQHNEDVAKINNMRPPGYSFTGIGRQQEFHNIEHCSKQEAVVLVTSDNVIHIFLYKLMKQFSN